MNADVRPHPNELGQILVPQDRRRNAVKAVAVAECAPL